MAIEIGKADEMEKLLDYVDKNIHYRLMQSLHDELHLMYCETLNVFSTLIRDIRYQEFSELFDNNYIKHADEDIAGYIRTLEIKINEFGPEYLNSLPDDLKDRLLSLIDRFGELIEYLESQKTGN